MQQQLRGVANEELVFRLLLTALGPTKNGGVVLADESAQALQPSMCPLFRAQTTSTLSTTDSLPVCLFQSLVVVALLSLLYETHDRFLVAHSLVR